MTCPCERFWIADSKTGCFNFCDQEQETKGKVIYWCAICGYCEEHEEKPRPRNCPRCGQGMFYSETKRN